MTERRVIRAHRREGDFTHNAFFDRPDPEPERLTVESADPEPWPLLYGPRGEVLTWGVDREIAGFKSSGGRA